MATCYRCGTLATDPGKGSAPWAIAVVGADQIIICPDCQRRDPGWADDALHCHRCDSTRMSKRLGDYVCRACGYAWSEDVFDLG